MKKIILRELLINRESSFVSGFASNFRRKFMIIGIVLAFSKFDRILDS